MSDAIKDLIATLKEHGARGAMVVFDDDQQRVVVMELRRYLEQGGALPLKRNTSDERLLLVDEILDGTPYAKSTALRSAIWLAIGRAENRGFDECLSFFTGEPKE